MSPRRNFPRRSAARRAGRAASEEAANGLDGERTRRGVQFTASWAGEEMMVRVVPGGAAVKTYRCPGCDHPIPPGMAHLVAWRAEGIDGPDDRRHWHTGCWRARDRRAPYVRRGRGQPRYG